MTRFWKLGSLFVVASALVLAGWSSVGADERRAIRVTLDGYQEVAAVSSTGTGSAILRLRDDSFDYELTYSGLEGNITQSHIHLGQRGVNGGIVIFLCTNLGNAPAGTTVPPCPGPSNGTVNGTRSAADVVTQAGQGIAAGEFEEVLRAIRSGNTYVNVHTTKHAPGEIRGQIHHDHGKDRD